jgi:hypothetical protein
MVKKLSFCYHAVSIGNIRIGFIHPTIKASLKVKLIQFYFILVTNSTLILHIVEIVS